MSASNPFILGSSTRRGSRALAFKSLNRGSIDDDGCNTNVGDRDQDHHLHCVKGCTDCSRGKKYSRGSTRKAIISSCPFVVHPSIFPAVVPLEVKALALPLPLPLPLPLLPPPLVVEVKTCFICTKETSTRCVNCLCCLDCQPSNCDHAGPKLQSTVAPAKVVPPVISIAKS